MREPYRDHRGRTEPEGGALYLGNARVGSVVQARPGGPVAKVVSHSTGSVTVAVGKGPRAFIPKRGPRAGEVIEIAGAAELTTWAPGAIVRRVRS